MNAIVREKKEDSAYYCAMLHSTEGEYFNYRRWLLLKDERIFFATSSIWLLRMTNWTEDVLLLGIWI